MKRTHARPIPSGKLPVAEATIVGGTMGVSGVGILYGFTNPVVAALVTSIFFLVFVSLSCLT